MCVDNFILDPRSKIEPGSVQRTAESLKTRGLGPQTLIIKLVLVPHSYHEVWARHRFWIMYHPTMVKALFIPT